MKNFDQSLYPQDTPCDCDAYEDPCSLTTTESARELWNEFKYWGKTSAMPWIENKAAQTKAAAITGAQVTGKALTTGAQKTGDALLLAKKTAVNGVTMFSF